MKLIKRTCHMFLELQWKHGKGLCRRIVQCRKLLSMLLPLDPHVQAEDAVSNDVPGKRLDS